MIPESFRNIQEVYVPASNSIIDQNIDPTMLSYELIEYTVPTFGVPYVRHMPTCFTTQLFNLFEIIELGWTAAPVGKEGKTVAIKSKKSIAELVSQSWHQWKLGVCQLPAESVCFRDRRVAPAIWPIELANNEGAVLEAQTINTVFITVQCQHSPVTSIALAFDCLQNPIRAEVHVSLDRLVLFFQDHLTHATAGSRIDRVLISLANKGNCLDLNQHRRLCEMGFNRGARRWIVPKGARKNLIHFLEISDVLEINGTLKDVPRRCAAFGEY